MAILMILPLLGRKLVKTVVIIATNTSVRQIFMLTKFLTTLIQLIEHTVEYLVEMA